MDLFNGRNIEGSKPDDREPIQSAQEPSPHLTTELMRGLKMTASDFLAAPCAEVWPDGDLYSAQRFDRIR